MILNAYKCEQGNHKNVIAAATSVALAKQGVKITKLIPTKICFSVKALGSRNKKMLRNDETRADMIS